MRPTVLSMIFWLAFSGSLSRSAKPPPQPGDATLGAKAPAGASVLLGEGRLEGWVQSDGKTPAKWPFADGILTVGHGDVRTEKTFKNFDNPVQYRNIWIKPIE